MSACSFLLGGWMLIQPAAFWEFVGAPMTGRAGASVAVQVLYAGAICGEGLALLMVYARPVQYLGFLHYMIVYKAVSCAGLAFWLLDDDSASPRLWLVVAAWACAGVIAALVYPWGRWNDLTRRQLGIGVSE